MEILHSRHSFSRLFCIIILISGLSQFKGFAQITVTNTNDAGAGSLRQAILDTNANIGADNIVFDVSLNGSTITLLTSVTITSGNGDATSIDGDTDSGGVPDVTIAATGNMTEIIVNAASCTVMNLNMIGFAGAPNAAISISGATATGNFILGNYISTNLAGTAISTANFRGIAITSGATNNSIGDGTLSGRNIISNSSFGVYINGADNNTVTGNIIGLDVTGSVDLGNLGSGVEIIGSDGTQVGVIGDLINVISGR